MSAPALPSRVAVGRPGTGRMLGVQTSYALLGLWRARVVAIFTFVLPVVWLLIVGAAAGNQTLDASTGLRVMQYATPSAIAMGVIYAAYPTVAIPFAEDRELGVLKRLRGTPLPTWIHLVGSVAASVVFALASLTACVAVGEFGFGVRIQWHTLPATVLTLVLGIACFAAIGLAVAVLSPSLPATQAISIGTAVALTFVSGLFNFGGSSPAWLERTGDVFPLKPFALALQDQFNPYHPGGGWEWRRLLVVVAWGVAAALVAVRWFPRERRTGGATAAVPVPARPRARPSAPVARARRPSPVAMVLAQAGAAARASLRDPASVFFAVLMPLGIYALIAGTQGRGVLVDGVPFEVFFAASMIVWGASVAVFMDLPEAVALDRERQVLKRLRGTPLAPWHYLAGRTTAGLVVAAVIAVLVLTVGRLAFSVSVPLSGLLVAVPVLVLGTLTMTACGFVLAAAVTKARAVGAVGLIILFPLGFFSSIFFAAGPAWMTTVGWFFPLAHFQRALVQAWQPGGPAVGWEHLAALVAWGVVAAVVAVRTFRWPECR